MAVYYTEDIGEGSRQHMAYIEGMGVDSVTRWMRWLRRLAFLIACLLGMGAWTGLADAPSLDGLSLQQLEAIWREADARLRQMHLPGIEGYVEASSWEAYRRQPADYIGDSLRLQGEIFWAAQASDQPHHYLYQVSLTSDPGQVFLINYQMQEDEPLLLPGDSITAFGTFEGLRPAPGADAAEIGLPSLRARLCTLQLPAVKPLAAPPYGATRSDPAPLNTTVTYQGSYWSGYAAVEIEVLSSLRGDAAQKRAKSMSAYNITPRRAQEYFMVELRIKALAAPQGKLAITNEDFFFVSASGAEYQHHFLINNQQPLRNLYPGSEQTAIIACMIDRGDRPLVVYLPNAPDSLWFDPNP